MKSIFLLGGGGHCRSCIDVIETEGSFDLAGIVTASGDESDKTFGYPVLGDDNCLPELVRRIDYAFVAVGQIKSPDLRMRLFGLLADCGAQIPILVSPLAHLSQRSEVGRGTIIMHGAIVNAGAVVGENCIINSKALVEHDSIIGAHCHVSTNACINGAVRVEDGCFIGSGSVIREGVKIGRGSIVGAGCVVLKDVAPGSKLRG